MNNKEEKRWEKNRLKEEFESEISYQNSNYVSYDSDRIVDFFWNEIEQIRKEDMERLVEVVKSKIQELPIKADFTYTGTVMYNQALEDAAKEIEKLIKE